MRLVQLTKGMADHESEKRKRQDSAQLLLDRNAVLIHTLHGVA